MKFHQKFVKKSLQRSVFSWKQPIHSVLGINMDFFFGSGMKFWIIWDPWRFPFQVSLQRKKPFVSFWKSCQMSGHKKSFSASSLCDLTRFSKFWIRKLAVNYVTWICYRYVEKLCAFLLCKDFIYRYILHTLK